MPSNILLVREPMDLFIEQTKGSPETVKQFSTTMVGAGFTKNLIREAVFIRAEVGT